MLASALTCIHVYTVGLGMLGLAATIFEKRTSRRCAAGRSST